MNRLFYHTGYSFPKVEAKDYNVRINEKNLFDQLAKNDLKTYENIKKISTGQEDDYATDHLLDNSYFKENYRVVGTDLSKEK